MHRAKNSYYLDNLFISKPFLIIILAANFIE
jgi:hypothetical protein